MSPGGLTEAESGRPRAAAAIICQLFCLSSGLEVLAEASAFVHGQFVEHTSWATSERPRAVQGVRVVDRASATTVTVVGLHGLRDATGKGDTPARIAQAK